MPLVRERAFVVTLGRGLSKAGARGGEGCAEGARGRRDLATVSGLRGGFEKNREEFRRDRASFASEGARIAVVLATFAGEPATVQACAAMSPASHGSRVPPATTVAPEGATIVGRRAMKRSAIVKGAG
jgi:hypothetical protein